MVESGVRRVQERQTGFNSRVSEWIEEKDEDADADVREMNE